MSVNLRGGRLWRCDGCGVESIPFRSNAPLGWARDEYPGGPHHWCPECLVVGDIEVGDESDWQAAWDELA